MKEITKVRIAEMVRKHVEPIEGFYEDYSSNVGEVTNYFLAAAKLFKEKGLSDEEIISIVKGSLGNYLLGKKYGVTPSQFVRNVMDVRNGVVKPSVT